MWADLGGKTVSALVNSLDALFRLKPRAQGGEALGNAVGGDVHVTPKGPAQLKRRNDLAGAGYEQTERSQLPGRQMNDRLSAQQSAIGLELEARKGKSLIPEAGDRCRGSKLSPSGQSGRKRRLPFRRSSFRVPFHLLAHRLQPLLDERRPPTVAREAARLAHGRTLRCSNRIRSA
jgi:hypothetical protein